MREEGLGPRRRARARPYSSYAGEEGMAGAPNLLLVDASRDLHDFSAGAARRASPTSRSSGSRRRRRYLSPVIDLFDGDVVAFSAPALQGPRRRDAEGRGGRRGRLPAALRPLALPHPDWVAECGRLGVTVSLSRKGHSPDNAAMEGFFGTLKVEFFRGRDWSG